MARFVTIGYGSREGYDRTDPALRDAAHAHDDRLRAAGVEVTTGVGGHGVVGVLRNGVVQALVATGGDTAVAILEVLGRRALQVVGDLLPGIPYCRFELDGRRVWLVTKAGGFGTPDALIEIVRRLRGGS